VSPFIEVIVWWNRNIKTVSKPWLWLKVGNISIIKSYFRGYNYFWWS
jgi:hypothetical protein